MPAAPDPERAPDPAVVARELTRRFGDFTAVDRVSFEVSRAEVFGFLGPNGAGKTTTIKMLAGLLTPSSGSGRVAGYDVASESEAIKRNIGYMSQLFSLYGDLTVDENITFFGGLYGVTGAHREERRAWVLDMARLGDLRDRLVAELPLGFRQRLALGCAVLHEPPILFLDEPTSGVDPVARRAFWDLIYELADAGTTVFVTTHYLEEAEYCHRLALMNRGQLIALGSPEELRHGLEQPVVEVRTPEAARLAGALDDAPGIVSVGLFGRTLHVTLEPGSGDPEARLRDLLDDLEVEPSELEVTTIEPSLEDVFVALVHQAGGAPED